MRALLAGFLPRASGHFFSAVNGNARARAWIGRIVPAVKLASKGTPKFNLVNVSQREPGAALCHDGSRTANSTEQLSAAVPFLQLIAFDTLESRLWDHQPVSTILQGMDLVWIRP